MQNVSQWSPSFPDQTNARKSSTGGEHVLAVCKCRRHELQLGSQLHLFQGKERKWNERDGAKEAFRASAIPSQQSHQNRISLMIQKYDRDDVSKVADLRMVAVPKMKPMLHSARRRTHSVSSCVPKRTATSTERISNARQADHAAHREAHFHCALGRARVQLDHRILLGRAPTVDILLSTMPGSCICIAGGGGGMVFGFLVER